jgi:membrane-associated phospholipid phosphatase
MAYAGEPAKVAAMTQPSDQAAPSPHTAPPVVPPDRITAEYFKDYFTDSGNLLVSPLKWSGGDWLTAGVVVGTTAGLFLVDTDIRKFAQDNQSPAGDAIAGLGSALGNPLYTLPALGGFYLYGHLYEDPKARHTTLLAVESLVISGAFSWTLKLATQGHRPFTGQPPNFWHEATTEDMLNPSFPSGHTTAAFSLASVFAEEYADNPYVPPVAYGLATLTGLARIYEDKHWASDVFFGATLGYFVGKTVVRYHSVLADVPVKVLPTVSKGGFGLMAEYRF